MSQDVKVFLLVLLVNLAAVLVFRIAARLRKVKISSLDIDCIIMIFTPVVGPAFFLLGRIMRRIFFHKPVDLSQTALRKDRFQSRIQINEKADEKKERNIVPLEEAMAVSGKDDTRVLVMDIVHRDISQSLSKILLALNSDDSEVAHYAASILQDALGTFRENVQKKYRSMLELEKEMAEADDPKHGKIMQTKEREAFDQEEKRKQEAGLFARVLARNSLESPLAGRGLLTEGMEKDSAGTAEQTAEGTAVTIEVEEEAADRLKRLEEEMDLAEGLMEDINAVLVQKVFTQPEQVSFAEMIDTAMEILDFRDLPDIPELSIACTTDIRTGRLPEAGQWCLRLQFLYPDALETYKCRMKLAYAEEKGDKFREILDEMKHSSVELDDEMLNMVRFFR